MADDRGEILLDPAALIKRLPSEQLAQFEPLSAIMLLNVDDDVWQGLVRRAVEGTSTEEDNRLAATYEHERYHFVQAAASGYMFDRQRTAYRVLNDAPPRVHPAEDPANAELIAFFRNAAGDDPVAAARVEDVIRLASQYELTDKLRGRAAPGDHSLAGAELPDFFAHLRQRREAERAANAQGLSILGVIEGSAVIAANLLGGGPDRAADGVREEVAALAPVYRELFAYTSAEAGERAIETALPATAVALCYARPHDAYCALLPMIASAPAGEAHARGRALFESPPAIAAAGPWLGDALAQRDADDSYQVYDPIHDSLRSGKEGVDTYELLADPEAIYRIGDAPLAMATRTTWYAGPASQHKLGDRAHLMSVVLKTQSRVRIERDLTRDLQDWGSRVGHRMLGGED